MKLYSIYFYNSTQNKECTQKLVPKSTKRLKNQFNFHCYYVKILKIQF